MTGDRSTHRLKFLSAKVIAGVAIAGFLTVPMGAYNTYAKWGSASIPYYVNPQNMDVSADAAELDVQEAASAWSKQSRASFAFYYAGRVTDTNLAYDNRNVVMFRNASSGGSALATTYSWFSGTSLTEADIVVWDGAYTFIAGNAPCYGGAYITDVLTHEFGHALGLMHSSVSSATMYPYYSMCSQGMRTLDPDDIAGVESLYPSTAPSNSSPSVTIASPSNGESDPQGTSVMFSGSATDTQDGDLSPNLVWTSSIDGQIGAGAAFLKPLSAGTHVITASVKDSGGITNSKQATVTMTAPCGRSNPTVTLSPSGLSLAAGTTQAFTMQVTNNDAATCGASSFALQPSVSAGWTAVLTALQLSVNPGSSAATTLKASVPIGTADGIYPIGGSATNGSASGYVGSSSVMVT